MVETRNCRYWFTIKARSSGETQRVRLHLSRTWIGDVPDWDLSSGLEYCMMSWCVSEAQLLGERGQWGFSQSVSRTDDGIRIGLLLSHVPRFPEKPCLHAIQSHNTKHKQTKPHPSTTGSAKRNLPVQKKLFRICGRCFKVFVSSARWEKREEGMTGVWVVFDYVGWFPRQREV